MGTLTFYPLSGFPEFTEGMDLPALLRERLEAQGLSPRKGDILVADPQGSCPRSPRAGPGSCLPSKPSPEAAALAERPGRTPGWQR